MYNECSTIQPDPSIIDFLFATNSNGFDDPDPYEPIKEAFPGASGYYPPAPLLNYGPDNIGANFDFDFGVLPAGKKHGFKIYYGAARTWGEADLAFSAINAEIWSYGGPSNLEVCTDMSIEINEHAVYIFAFGDLAGLAEEPTQSPTMEPTQ